MEKAVIDRIIDGKTVVILVGESEQQHYYPADKLPENAREGTWLRVRVESGEIVAMAVGEEETDAVRRRIQEKMDKLRERWRGST